MWSKDSGVTVAAPELRHVMVYVKEDMSIVLL
jgi:hypothetical protein